MKKLFTSTLLLLFISLLPTQVVAAPTLQFSGFTYVEYSDEFQTAVGALGLSVDRARPARTSSSAALFPITTGLLDFESAAGEIAHSGGLILSAGSIELELRNFSIETRRGVLSGVAVAGDTFVGRIDLFKLSLPDLSLPLHPRRNLYLPYVGLSLTDDAAMALNSVFGVSAFAEGTPIGTAYVILRGGRN